jgi:hypothetical protein
MLVRRIEPRRVVKRRRPTHGLTGHTPVSLALAHEHLSKTQEIYMETRVMASASTIWCYRLAGVVFVANGVAFTGIWSLAVGWVLLSFIWFFIAHRVSHCPILVIRDKTIQILAKPAFPPIEVQIADVIDVIVTRSKAKIVLKGDKIIKLPLPLLKTEKENVIRCLVNPRICARGDGARF